MPIAPNRVNDGNFSIPQINGTPNISYPFINEGDAVSWEYRIKLRVDKDSYKEPALLLQVNTPKGIGYIIDPGNPEDVGSGLYEYTVVVASIPVNRVVGQTINGTFIQYNGLLIQWGFTIPTNAQVLTEYGLTPFQPLQPPVIVYGNARPYYYGLWASVEFSPAYGAPVEVIINPVNEPRPWPPGSTVVAQASKCSVYKGGMYMRETFFITYPNVQALNPVT